MTVKQELAQKLLEKTNEDTGAPPGSRSPWTNGVEFGFSKGWDAALDWCAVNAKVTSTFDFAAETPYGVDVDIDSILIGKSVKTIV